MQPPWWMTNPYESTEAMPDDLTEFSGPNGVALVRAWKDGRTDPGWGLWRPGSTSETNGFMWKYEHQAFAPAPILRGYQLERWAFAFIMRSLRMVCIDIDGKNGGLLHAGKLGMLPYTLAETSKSGDGYHLWYATTEDEWDPVTGFAQFADRISLEQGVDLRATGCIYHHPQQRWNRQPVAELPAHLKTRLTNHAQAIDARMSTIVKTLETQDQEEIVIMQDALLDDLKKPVPPGRRNTTLFAIGNQMKLAEIPGWEKQIYDRATELGLDDAEATKLVVNVRKYGDN